MIRRSSSRRARSRAGSLATVWLTLATLWGCRAADVRSAGAPCGSEEEACPTATTCWPANGSAELECLPSDATGIAGAACTQKVGEPSCADGLGCDQVGPEAGVCTYYCDPVAAPCPAGFACRVTRVGSEDGPIVDVCRPEPDAGDQSASDADAPYMDAGAIVVVSDDGAITSDGARGGGWR